MLEQDYAFSLLRLTLLRDLTKTTFPENYAVLPVCVAQWTQKTIPEFFQITIALLDRQNPYENKLFLKLLELYKIKNLLAHWEIIYWASMYNYLIAYNAQIKWTFVVASLHVLNTSHTIAASVIVANDISLG